MASRGTNTFPEWLERTAQDVAQAMGLPDADLQFLTAILDAITQKRREPLDRVNAMLGQQQGAPGAPMDAQMAAAAPMSGPQPGVAGIAGRPQLPNMDEMARMLGGR